MAQNLEFSREHNTWFLEKLGAEFATVPLDRPDTTHRPRPRRHLAVRLQNHAGYKREAPHAYRTAITPIQLQHRTCSQ